MLVLVLFAGLAGAGTAISPCVLPILPALLSAGSVGGRRRPAGIVLGLTVTFAVSIVALAELTRALGLGTGITRTFAVVVLIAFGITLLVPRLSDRVRAPLSRLARFGPRSRGDGFLSGLGVGAALGFVCAPCGGPILAAVISVGAAGSTSLRVVLVGVAFSVGLSTVLGLYCVGGRRVIGALRQRARGPIVETALGVIMLATGLAMAVNLDVTFESRLAQGLAPGRSSVLAFLIDPTQAIENSGAVRRRLASLRAAPAPAAESGSGSIAPPPASATPPSSTPVAAVPRPVRHRPAARAPVAPRRGGRPTVVRRHAARRMPPATTVVAVPRPTPAQAGVGLLGVRTPALPDRGPAPDFAGTERWFNTPGGAAVHLSELRGKVVLVDFWTYTCINCIRTLPYLKGLYATYHRAGLEIVGIHTPEFTFEHDAGNVGHAVAADGLPYPVGQDNDYAVWNAYKNQYWPGQYLVDARGHIRFVQLGEGDDGPSEAAIRRLLYDAGANHLPAPTTARAETPTGGLATAETYLGSLRARFLNPAPTDGTHVYPGAPSLPPGRFALRGPWRVTSEWISPAAAPGAEIDGAFHAARVYLVMTSVDGRPRRARVRLDGAAPPLPLAGGDVHGGLVTVRRQRLYALLALPGDETHTVAVQLPPGVRAFVFTFG